MPIEVRIVDEGITPTWTSKNTKHLTTSLAWLRLRLTGLVENVQKSDQGTQTIAETEVEEAAAAMLTVESVEPPPALVYLSRQFGLSRFEQETLLLCAAMELDTRTAHLCGLAQGDLQRPYPTFALALTLFDDPAWDILSPRRPLRHWRLIEIFQRDGQPLISSQLRADERIVNYLKGLVYLDDRLAPFVMSGQIVDSKRDLPPQRGDVCGLPGG